MKNIIDKIKKLSVSKKIQLAVALFLTVAVIIAIPVYAWFSNQRKAAEMYKVEYPNSLFINAAHREDRIYFGLDGIKVNEYEMTPDGSNYARDENNNLIQIREQYYIFSVSGSNTRNFLLQMAHTNNNLFTYTVYEATQYSNEAAATAAVTTTETDEVSGETITTVDKSRLVTYAQHAGSHTENNIQVIGDTYVDNATSDLYYVRAVNPVSGSYINVAGGDAYPANTNDRYYNANYGTNDNVQRLSVPSYWQTTVNLTDDEIDANKQFSKYFILRVTWGDEQNTQVEKETDLIYFSVKRQ